LTSKDKKDSIKSVNTNSKGPKSELDDMFLSLVEHIMKTHGVKSHSALSKELGKGVDLISKVRRGLQHAPPDAWDALFAKYPDARNITANNVMVQGNGQAIGTNYGEANQDIDHLKPKHQAGSIYYEWNNLRFVPAETHDALKREVELLERQLADKERIINLLEQSLNKPA
jgi:hypothetical protein